MIIHGLQKMTLLDFPGKVAATVFLGGCDFRCPFCHNSDLLDMRAPGLMDSGELLDFLKSRRGLLDGVAITGGEPLLRPDLPELLEQIRALGFSVKLDTNGTHPDRLKALLEAGLADYVAMDIKNSPERYGATVGWPEMLPFEPVLQKLRESIALLLEGRIPFEFRTTVVREFHDESCFTAIGELIQGAPAYYLQKFTDRESVLSSGLTAPSAAELKRYAELVSPFVGRVSLRGVEDADL